jgi:hypothetical protein
MRATSILLAAVLFSLSLVAQPGDPKVLAVPADQTARAQELVRRLDDDDVDVRDRASADLKAMGRLAIPALVEAMKGKPSNEMTLRVERLLPAARKDDFDTRYPVFLQDTDGKYDHSFLGWDELKKAAGDTPEARKLFTAILTDNESRAMLMAALAPSLDERKAFEKRWTTKWMAWLKKGGGGDPNWPVEWNAAALLADLVYGRDYYDGTRVMSVRGCLQRTDEGKLAVQEKGKYGKAVRALIRYWVGGQMGSNGMFDASELVTHLKFDHPTRLDLFEKLLVMPENRRRVHVMEELARTKDVKYVAHFKKLFDNTEDQHKGGVIGNDGTPWVIEHRDTALAMCLLLTQQKHEDYGFTVLRSNTNDPYWTDRYQFRSDKGGATAEEKREAAFKKWAEWEKTNPLPSPKDKK